MSFQHVSLAGAISKHQTFTGMEYCLGRPSLLHRRWLSEGKDHFVFLRIYFYRIPVLRKWSILLSILISWLGRKQLIISLIQSETSRKMTIFLWREIQDLHREKKRHYSVKRNWIHILVCTNRHFYKLDQLEQQCLVNDECSYNH